MTTTFTAADLHERRGLHTEQQVNTRMDIFLNLSVLAVRKLVNVVTSTELGVVLINKIRDHFTDDSQKLNKALQKANDRAWKSFELALTGKQTLWQRCKSVFSKAEDKAFTEQMRTFLDNRSNQLEQITANPKYCQICLEELRIAGEKGLFRSGSVSRDNLAQKTAGFAKYADAKSLLDAEWMVVKHMATELRQEGCSNLAKVLEARPVTTASNPEGTPLLVMAVRYFLRLEIQEDQKLFQGLAIDKLDDLAEKYRIGFDALHGMLANNHQRLEGLLTDVVQWLKGIDKRVIGIEQSVLKILEVLQKLESRVVRPSDSLSIRSDSERQHAKQVIQDFRSLPEANRQQAPGLISLVGKLEVATGDFAAAQRDFQEAAKLAVDKNSKAEAHYNAYQSALERKAWSDALSSLREAVAIDAPRFAPFPFSKYEPKQILGAGGFGVVFKCRHTITNADVVVKSLTTTELDRDLTEVFQEAVALESLNHPNIIRLKDCAYADSGKTHPYLVMDYFEGQSLDVLVEKQALTPKELLAVAVPVAEALRAAHAKGLLHRDVKPANLLVRHEGDTWHVKLIDFGLAMKPETLDDKASTGGPQARTTMGKSIAGTLHYAAPEQMEGGQVGFHSDVYGFGRMAYYALLRTPQPDDVEKELLPEAWRKLLSKCTGNKLVNRLPDFASVLAGLAEIAKDPQWPSPKPTPQPSQVGDYSLKSNGIEATGRDKEDFFYVLAGSQAVKVVNYSLPENLLKLRNGLIQEGTLIEGADCFTLKEESAFNSASEAASVLLGINVDGRSEWRGTDGRTLKQMQEAGVLTSRLSKIEAKIRSVERFKVIIKYEGNDEMLPSYWYVKAANNTFTIAQWRKQRFQLYYPNCMVTVLLGDGTEAHGVTKLATVRDSYD